MVVLGPGHPTVPTWGHGPDSQLRGAVPDRRVTQISFLVALYWWQVMLVYVLQL